MTYNEQQAYCTCTSDKLFEELVLVKMNKSLLTGSQWKRFDIYSDVCEIIGDITTSIPSTSNFEGTAPSCSLSLRPCVSRGLPAAKRQCYYIYAYANVTKQHNAGNKA